MKLVAASAPGKLMISGEYAVLEGALAVVAAVDVRVYARWGARDEGAEALPPEAQKTRELAERELGAIAAELSINRGDLFRGTRKFGLGSSAAAAAAVAGAVLAAHGHDLNEPSVQRRAFELALAGHKAIAPQGSGADVAASALGGFVRYRLAGDRAEAERVRFPDGLHARVVWTGKVARTSEFVGAVRAFAAADGAGFARVRDQLREQAERFAGAIARAELPAIIDATRAYGLAMGELGRAIRPFMTGDAEIVTAELAEIARLAEAHGGAAKPSGAGGGDVAIALFPARDGAADFERACADASLEVLNLTLGAPGVRAE